MNKVGITISPEDIGSPSLKGIKIFQLMTQDTKTGNIIWTPDKIAKLRKSINGQDKLYSHAMFKIVLGKYYPTMDLFCEHYKYLCDMKIYGYVIHIPSNIDMDYCISFVKKLFNRVKDSPRYTRVFFEHIPSETYCNANKLAEFGRRLAKINILPVGLCLDTCHIYASGIDISSYSAIAEYVKIIESAKLPYIIHLNDSVGELGSFVDRHDSLGNRIWLNDKSGLRYIMQLQCDKIIELGESSSSLSILADGIA